MSRWLFLELWDDGWGAVLDTIAVVSMISVMACVAWVELQRKKRSLTSGPLVVVVLTSVVFVCSWLFVVERERGRYLQLLLRPDLIAPSQHARQVAVSLSVLVDASAIAAVSLLGMGVSGLWIVWRGRRLGGGSSAFACGFAGAVVVSFGILVRTSRLVMRFHHGGESLDASESLLLWIRIYEGAGQALETARVAVVLLVFLGSIFAVVLHWRSPVTPSRRDWRYVAALLVLSTLVFAFTRRHRKDFLRPTENWLEVRVPCSGDARALPPLIGAPLRSEAPIVMFREGQVSVDGIAVEDVTELNEILRAKQELWMLLRPGVPFPHRALIVAAPSATPTAAVLRWVDALDGTPALAALVVEQPMVWKSSVFGNLQAPARCVAVSVNPRQNDKRRPWGEVVMAQQERRD